MGWTMLYLFVFLKLPILAACYIVWWAIHQTDETDDVPDDGGSKVPRGGRTRGGRAARARRAAVVRPAERASRRRRASALGDGRGPRRQLHQ